MRTKTDRFRCLTRASGCAIPLILAVGCSVGDGGGEADAESAATRGLEVASCSVAASSGYDTTSSALTITMGPETNLVLGVVGKYLSVNGYPCVKPSGVQLTPAMVKKIGITGTQGDDKVVIDLLTGALGPTILSGTAGGIIIDLGADSAGDEFSVRGSAGAEKWSAGTQGSDTYFEINGDQAADIRLLHAESASANLAGGNDIFSAAGPSPALTATHLNGGVTTLVTLPVALSMTVGGGDGNDTLTGGAGNDSLNGGAGNDVVKASGAIDGDDTISGGSGTDTVDYSARNNALAVTLDGITDSGEGSEKDHLGVDVEDLIGGLGDDMLTGNTASNHIRGGAGADVISGGINAGACTSDVDVLDGEGGDDTFDQGLAADCGDVVNGGGGTDRVDYQGRSADLTISVDGLANDGDPTGASEKDNVKADVEIVISGGGNDRVSGSANSDELHGGPGNDVLSGGLGNDRLSGDAGDDTLNGEAGNDTFDESGVDPEYLVSQNKGDGDDTLNGGTHDSLGLDTVDYSARSGPVSASICSDSTHLTGAANPSLAGNCADHDGEPMATESDDLVNVMHVIGTAGNDVLVGGSADDLLEGRAGADNLDGGAGNDTLFGDAGDDSLLGGPGDDYLDGGASTTKDILDGGSGASGGGGDICISRAGDDVFNCEL